MKKNPNKSETVESWYKRVEKFILDNTPYDSTGGIIIGKILKNKDIQNLYSKGYKIEKIKIVDDFDKEITKKKCQI